MKSKSFFVLLLITFFSVIITPEFAAATAQQQSPVFATEQMPAWLAEAGAVPVSDAQLENVQGESIAAIVMGAAAVIMLAQIAYLHYKLIKGKSFTPNEKMFLDEVCGFKFPQFPNAQKELLWIQGR